MRVYDSNGATSQALSGIDRPADYPPVFTRDSRRLLVLCRDRLVVFGAQADDWNLEKSIEVPLKHGVRFPYPRRMALDHTERFLLLAHYGVALRMDLQEARLEPLLDGATDVRTAHYLPDNTLVVGRWSADVSETIFRSAAGERVVSGAVWEMSFDGELCLVAPGVDSAREAAFPLEIRETASQRVVGRFKVSYPGSRFKFLTQASFSQDKRFLFTAENFAHVLVRDGRSGEILQHIRSYEDDRIVSIGSGGDLLLTAGRPSLGVFLWKRRPP